LSSIRNQKARLAMQTMQIDTDLLERVAAASGRAAEQAHIHIDGEIMGLIPELMETLSPEGPYAYTIIPEVRPDGSVRLPVLTTREEIRGAYEMICDMRFLRSVSSLTEIRGEWYTFADSISRTERRATGQQGASETVALFPSGRAKGITGELVWLRVPRAALGARREPSEDVRNEMFVREDVFLLYSQYIEALERGDVEAVLATFNDGVASAVRDYVNDTGTLVMLEGKAAHRAYYEALFDKFEIRSVQPLDRVAEEWYVFGELRMTAARRGSADLVTFNTAEFFIPANDGRFIARIGHGTDPASSGLAV
jgi:hypothetical protein